MSIGIYKITNLAKESQNIYIGQSSNIEKRWQNHLSDLNLDRPLYRAIKKYGVENFKFEIIEICLVSELDEREIYWINYYDSFFNGYNLTLGGNGSGYDINKEKIIGIIKDLETTTLYQKDIASKWGISEEMVQGINTGRYWHRDIKYPIRDRVVAPEKYYCNFEGCHTEIDRQSKHCPEHAHYITRVVKERPDPETLIKEIKESSMVEVGRKYGVSDNAIRKWLKAYGLPTSSREIKKM